MNKVARKQSTKRTDQEKLDLIAQWKKSGLPIKAFCQQYDFSNSVFHAWLNKYDRGTVEMGSRAFVPLQVASNAVNEPVRASYAEIVLASGTRIQLY